MGTPSTLRTSASSPNADDVLLDGTFKVTGISVANQGAGGSFIVLGDNLSVAINDNISIYTAGNTTQYLDVNFLADHGLKVVSSSGGTPHITIFHSQDGV